MEIILIIVLGLLLLWGIWGVIFLIRKPRRRHKDSRSHSGSGFSTSLIDEIFDLFNPFD